MRCKKRERKAKLRPNKEKQLRAISSRLNYLGFIFFVLSNTQKNKHMCPPPPTHTRRHTHRDRRDRHKVTNVKGPKAEEEKNSLNSKRN